MLGKSVNRLASVLRRFKSEFPPGSTCFEITKDMEKYLQCRKDVKLEMCIIDDNVIDPCWELPKIVIIGAGIAGLSAAQRLVSSGLTKLTVVEATHRAGGRMHSAYFGNVPVEIGATHIEGASLSNQVYTLASQEGLNTKPPIKEDPYAGISFTSDGEDIPMYIAKAAQKSFNSIITHAADLYVTSQDNADCGRLFEFILKQMDKELAWFPFKYRDVASRVMLSEAVSLKNKIGTCLNQVSAKFFGSYAELSGGRLLVPSGMIGTLAPLLRAMPECETIKYCKPVTKIIWTNKEEYEDPEKKKRKPRAKVVCCDGHVLNADYVIVTVPLGYLKKHQDTMFIPSMPEPKKEAINRLGYGTMNHVYFEYNRPFWVWQEGTIRPCWRLDEIKDNQWTRGISVIKEVANSQQILSVTLSHDAARCVEELNEIELAEDFTKLLRRFLDNPTIPYPANILRTKWTTSPYSLGAKTYIKYGSNPSDICEYGKSMPDECEPGAPVIYFAGEGTISGAFGTLHGARMSGIREAEKILANTRRFQGRPMEKFPDSVCENVTAEARG